MIHLSRAQNGISVENNVSKVTGSLAMLSHSLDKSGLESLSAKIILRVNKARSLKTTDCAMNNV